MAELTRLVSESPLSWIPSLTLLLLLTSQPWKQYMPIGTLAHFLGVTGCAMAAVGLLMPQLNQSSTFWFGLACVHFGWLLAAYLVADNHHYLEGYWCIAIAIALQAGGVTGEVGLRRGATWLIGLTFALAVAAKLLSREYRQGSFFAATLLSDIRFIPLAVHCGGLRREDRARHALALARVRGGVSDREQVTVSKRMRGLALLLTWWTIAIEGAVAIAFLDPLVGSDTVRIVCLVMFAITTFVCVPVPAFGQILLVMLLVSIQSPHQRAYVLLLTLAVPVISFAPHFARRATILLSSALRESVTESRVGDIRGTSIGVRTTTADHLPYGR